MKPKSNKANYHHITLLGDSILDNGAYVQPGEPDVITQLRGKLPEEWQATLRAVDGSITDDVKGQVRGLPEDASFLIVSVGGNDALSHISIFNQNAQSTAEVLQRLADIRDKFQRNYQSMLKTVLSCNLPTAICSIYYPRFPDPALQRVAIVGLSVFNDCIIYETFRFRLPLIDLRLICNEDRDYANEIEPSVHGGEKITDAILKVAKEFDSRKTRTVVFT
ncbi:MAG TPA: SGNH/GDSL hydrolase family protein [Thermodesulfobacteriota bacterium]|nr:SGNH/GDSL hydrolase family protein [Thermodesulfobacteriota bacterium]